MRERIKAHVTRHVAILLVVVCCCGIEHDEHVRSLYAVSVTLSGVWGWDCSISHIEIETGPFLPGFEYIAGTGSAAGFF